MSGPGPHRKARERLLGSGDACTLSVMRWVVLLLACVTGCGGATTPDPGTDASSDTLTDSTAADSSADVGPLVDAGNYCTDLAARAAKCGKSFDAAKCAKQAVCYPTVIKAEDLEGILGCLSRSDCSVSEDSCLLAPTSKYASDPTAQAYAKKCLDKRGTCAGAYPDDLCTLFHAALKPAYLAQASACFDKPCAEVRACYDAIFKAAGCS